eukprot:182675_1
MKSFQTAFMFVQAALFINPCVESLALLSLWTFSSVSFNIYDVIIILFLSLVYNMLPMSICLHRYFSHQAFQTNRFGQCMLAIIGTLANQGGVLWWSSIHRKHHKYCDTKHDPHSWSQTSFIYAFLGWTCYEWRMDWDYVPNKFKKNELLVLINNSYGIIQLVFICFGTLSANAAFHPKSYKKKDTCQSVDLTNTRLWYAPFVVANGYLVGETHHDDHHKHPQKAHRPGLDLTYYMFLKPLQALGIIYDLK